MSLSNEQIVFSLISYYKNKGIDLSHVLSDPVFQSLKMPDRIEAIKRHASEIIQGSNHDISKVGRDALKADVLIGISTGIGAGITAKALAKEIMYKSVPHTTQVFSHVKPNLVAWGATIGVGALVGGMAGYMSGSISAADARDRRKALLRSVHEVSKNPSTENAIGVFSHIGQVERENVFRNKILNRIASDIDKGKQRSFEFGLPRHYLETYDRADGHFHSTIPSGK